MAGVFVSIFYGRAEVSISREALIVGQRVSLCPLLVLGHKICGSFFEKKVEIVNSERRKLLERTSNSHQQAAERDICLDLAFI